MSITGKPGGAAINHYAGKHVNVGLGYRRGCVQQRARYG
jgi:hypothetical protein